MVAQNSSVLAALMKEMYRLSLAVEPEESREKEKEKKDRDEDEDEEANEHDREPDTVASARLLLRMAVSRNPASD